MNIKSFENPVKIFIVVFYSFFILLYYSCTSGGHYEFKEPINKEVCDIDGKSISRFKENIDIPFFREFIFGYRGIYGIFHIYYEDETGNRNNIITYKFPFSYGLDNVSEDTGLLIEETPDVIRCYYDREPEGGFIVENNPFSKKIEFKYWDGLKWLQMSGRKKLCSI